MLSLLVGSSEVAVEAWEVVEARWAARLCGDIASQIELVDEDLDYSCNLPAEIFPFAGQFEGWPAFHDRLIQLRTQYSVPVYRPFLLSVNGEEVRGRIEYRLRHRATGLEITGSARQIAHVRAGKIVRLEEYQDVERFRVFSELIAHAGAGYA
jgi:ketosteroid isomerase-like protein